jgi:predicted enzyme related to lactoylglutathione lyase
MAAPLCHFEFMSDSPEKCKSFYAGVFGWEFDDSSMPGYTMVNTGKEPGGGLMQRPAEAPHPALNVYFMVDDIEATLDKVKGAGGTVVVPKTPIPNVGAYAIFLDPEEICVGIFQS